MVRCAASTSLAGAAPASSPLNAHIVNSAVAAKTCSGGRLEGLSAGALRASPATAPSAMIARSGTSFASVITICATPVSRTPRSAMSVSVHISASASAVCAAGASPIPGAKLGAYAAKASAMAGMAVQYDTQ